jgi:hypothetical protein
VQTAAPLVMPFAQEASLSRPAAAYGLALNKSPGIDA